MECFCLLKLLGFITGRFSFIYTLVYFLEIYEVIEKISKSKIYRYIYIIVYTLDLGLEDFLYDLVYL